MHPIILYLLCWIIYYILLEFFNKKRGPEWNSRIVAFTHAIVICRLIEQKITHPWQVDEYGLENTYEMNNILLLSLSYFLFETSWCLYMQTEGFSMMLHHFISLFGLYTAVHFNCSGYEICFMVWAGEFTNPFLQIRWFLRTAELHKTWYATMNEVLFVVLFLFMRLFVGSYICFMIFMRSPNAMTLFRFSSGAFHFVNMLFVIQVLMFVKRKLFSPRMVSSK